MGNRNMRRSVNNFGIIQSFIAKTNDKREYRRAVAVFQKADGKTYDYIAERA